MKLELNIEKKYFLAILSAVVILAAVFGVYAYGTSNPAVFGHSAGEIEGGGGFALIKDITTTSDQSQIDITGLDCQADQGYMVVISGTTAVGGTAFGAFFNDDFGSNYKVHSAGANTYVYTGISTSSDRLLSASFRVFCMPGARPIYQAGSDYTYMQGVWDSLSNINKITLSSNLFYGVSNYLIKSGTRVRVYKISGGSGGGSGSNYVYCDDSSTSATCLAARTGNSLTAQVVGCQISDATYNSIWGTTGGPYGAKAGHTLGGAVFWFSGTAYSGWNANYQTGYYKCERVVVLTN